MKVLKKVMILIALASLPLLTIVSLGVLMWNRNSDESPNWSNAEIFDSIEHGSNSSTSQESDTELLETLIRLLDERSLVNGAKELVGFPLGVHLAKVKTPDNEKTLYRKDVGYFTQLVFNKSGLIQYGMMGGRTGGHGILWDYSEITAGKNSDTVEIKLVTNQNGSFLI